MRRGHCRTVKFGNYHQSDWGLITLRVLKFLNCNKKMSNVSLSHVDHVAWVSVNVFPLIHVDHVTWVSVNVFPLIHVDHVAWVSVNVFPLIHVDHVANDRKIPRFLVNVVLTKGPQGYQQRIGMLLCRTIAIVKVFMFFCFVFYLRCMNHSERKIMISTTGLRKRESKHKY